MNERLKKLRKTLGLSQENFGKRIGVTKTAISRAEAGLNSISHMSIKSMCREFGVNEEWLRTGSGNMFEEMSLAEQAARVVGRVNGRDDKFIINKFIFFG